MICTICGFWYPADPETGFDADDVCPECGRRDAPELPAPEAPTEGELDWE